jgi:hypothetical protein
VCMSGNSVENSQANCSPVVWLRITLKHRAPVVKMKGRDGGRGDAIGTPLDHIIQGTAAILRKLYKW